MTIKRMALGVCAGVVGVAAMVPEAAASATMSIAEVGPALVEQHAATGGPMLVVAALVAAAMRRQRAWYSDPRLAEMLAPLPQDYMYLPPR